MRGEGLSGAIEKVKKLKMKGGATTFTCLGEFRGGCEEGVYPY